VTKKRSVFIVGGSQGGDLIGEGLGPKGLFSRGKGGGDSKEVEGLGYSRPDDGLEERRGGSPIRKSVLKKRKRLFSSTPVLPGMGLENEIKFLYRLAVRKGDSEHVPQE